MQQRIGGLIIPESPVFAVAIRAALIPGANGDDAQQHRFRQGADVIKIGARRFAAFAGANPVAFVCRIDAWNGLWRRRALPLSFSFIIFSEYF